jgi:hypothetical protein
LEGLYRRRGSIRSGPGHPHHRAARPGAGSCPLVVRLVPGPSPSPPRSSGSFVKYCEVRLLFRPISRIFPV